MLAFVNKGQMLSSIKFKNCILAIFSKRKSMFNFGTCSERKTFAEKTVPSRLGILYPIKNDHPNLGPGTYDMEVFASVTQMHPIVQHNSLQFA